MAEHAPIGLIGKHPGYGDFLRTGLSEPVAETFGNWLDGALFALRDEMGQGWAEFWDSAQDLRFWIGRAVSAHGRTLAGVMRPSRDRVGRRYPLVLIAEGADLAAPIEAPGAQGAWEALSAHLDAMQPGEGARALLAGLDFAIEAEGEAAVGEGPTVWAHHPEGNLASLLRAAQPVDAHRATAARSYWWAPGGHGRAAVWLGCNGLPGAPELGWLFAGEPGEDPLPEVPMPMPDAPPLHRAAPPPPVEAPPPPDPATEPKDEDAADDA